MRRICSEPEKQLIQANSSQILNGLYRSTSANRTSDVFIALGLYFVLLFATMVPLIILFSEKNITEASGFIFFVYTVGLLLLSIFLVRFFGGRIRNAKNRKTFIGSERMEVSGATVMEIRHEGKKTFLTYIEDDERGLDKKPYIMEYPAAAGDLEGLKCQDRLIVLYSTDGSQTISYQLMRRTDATRRLIPDYPPLNTGAINPAELSHYPHPNALRIEYKEKILTPSNREPYVQNALEQYRAQNNRVLKICSIILFICANLIVSIFTLVQDGPANGFKTVCIYVAANAAVIWFMSFAASLRKRSEKKLMDFVSVTEVLFQSHYSPKPNLSELFPDTPAYVPDNPAMAPNITVYEWDGQRFVMNNYCMPVNYKGVLGDILYKFLLKNGNYVLYPKK